MERCKLVYIVLGYDAVYRMAWIDLAQDRDQWRCLMNTVMNLQVP
jgi:hypothetical protein